MPLVSVALAVYNGEKYLRQQVESILNQTVADIELVMSDDCSIDGSWKVMEQLATEDSRIRIYRNESNLGFKDNFGKAIEKCHGEYIALSDCDDIWEPNHLEMLLDIIGDKALACGNSTLVDADGIPTGTTLRQQEALDWIPNDDMKKLLSIILFRNPYQGATMLMRRTFIDKALPIPSKMRYHDTWFASLACFCGGISYTKQSLMKYRRTNASITGLRSKRKSKLYRFLHLRFDDDRLDILQCIEQRLGGRLNYKQRRTISQLRNMLNSYNKNHHDIRIRLYELMHYKSIYSCDATHWI